MLNSHQITRLQQLGLTRKKIADFKGVSERTIYRWSKQNKVYDYWSHRHRKWGRKSKLTGEVLKSFLAYVDKGIVLTQQELADYASQLAEKKITRFIISRVLKEYEISRKKITYCYTEMDIKKAEEFEAKLFSMLDMPILALDECSFHIGEAPRYGYSKRGLRVNSRKTGKKSINYTLLLCVSNVKKYGVVYYWLKEGAVKAEDFHEFLSEIELPTNTETHLVMDNVRIHHANQACKKLGLSAIKELLASKNIQPLYLPPYTPMLNPTEFCFNFIRHYVEKDQPKIYEELEQAIDKTINMLGEKDMTKFFRHCYFTDPRHKLVMGVPKKFP